MAIRRVSSSRRKNSTRSANPGTSAGAKKAWATRRKKAAARKRAAKKGAATRKRNQRKSASTRKSSTKKGGVRKTARKAYTKKRRYTKRRVSNLRSKSTKRPVSITVRANPKRRRRRKQNPAGMFMLPMIGGVDTGAVAVGTLTAIVLKNLFKNVGFIKKAVAEYVPKDAQPFVGPALIVGLGYLANKKAKNRHVKVLGAYAAAAAIVLAVDDFADQKIGEFIGDKLGGGYHNYGGGYVQLKGYNGLQGNMGGMHLPLSGNTAGMFGGASNLA